MTQVPPAPPTLSDETRPKGSSMMATCRRGTPWVAAAVAALVVVGGGHLCSSSSLATNSTSNCSGQGVLGKLLSSREAAVGDHLTLAPYAAAARREARTPPLPAPIVTRSYSYSADILLPAVEGLSRCFASLWSR